MFHLSSSPARRSRAFAAVTALMIAAAQAQDSAAPPAAPLIVPTVPAVSQVETKAAKPEKAPGALKSTTAAKPQVQPPQGGAETIIVVLDEAKVLQLPQNATTVIVGNPIIADVTMLKKTNQMVLTGKGFGQTNLIALDSRGQSVGESTLRVVNPAHGLVLQRGLERESYDCSPRCQPTARLGDSQKFTAETVTAITGRNQASQPAR